MKQLIKQLTLILCLVFSGSAVFAQITTSSLSGRVTDENQEPLTGAAIVAVHTPSGTQYAAIANESGRFNITGMRENIMLIRTDADGKRSVHRLNLNDKELILSPYYNLQQNDVIYVQPNASKARSSWSIPPALSLTLSSIGTLISIATLIVTIAK